MRRAGSISWRRFGGPHRDRRRADIIKVGDLYDSVSRASGSCAEARTALGKSRARCPDKSTISRQLAVLQRTNVTVVENNSDTVVFATAPPTPDWGCAVWGPGSTARPYVAYGGFFPVYHPYYPSYGYHASYNPWVGSYSRGVSRVHGPYGGAGVEHATTRGGAPTHAGGRVQVHPGRAASPGPTTRGRARLPPRDRARASTAACATGAIVASQGTEHLKLEAETRLQFTLNAAVTVRPERRSREDTEGAHPPSRSLG